MAQITAGNLEVVDLPNGVKKLQVVIQITFEVDCPCDQISVRVYTHSVSAGGSITTPSGVVSKGVVTDPQGVRWTWTAGRDGWITDSVDTNPNWNAFTCNPGANGNVVKIADSPGIGIPPGSQGAGYTYAYEYSWKVDVLCRGQVIDQEFYRITMRGAGGPNGPTPGLLGAEQKQAALDEVNQKMRAAGTAVYPVDAEGKAWTP
ncbi:MAG: hypothetical protein ACR2MT_02195 [Aurantibacter sp.]